MASLTLPLAAALASFAPAQQFVQAVGALPGPAVWSEGVCAADVDRDGDLDLLFANGDGFSSVGPKRQNVLVINKLVELGSATFVDESVLRFGVHVSNAKMVIAGDVLATGENPTVLYARSKDQANPETDKDALATVAALRTMANYFQEFGSALKADTLSEHYAHELLGGVCQRYSSSLTPFILEARKQYGRERAYEEVLLLGKIMAALDR